MSLSGSPNDLAVLALVLAARLLVPLLIPWYPLPGVLAALTLDAVDQSLFQGLTRLPLEGYQAYDKALDVYYQSIAYLSTLRNWENDFAFRVGRVLFYARLVGVAQMCIRDRSMASSIANSASRPIANCPPAVSRRRRAS